MFKIHSFDDFSRIFEAEEGKSKSYDQTLDLIMSTILGSYSSLLTFPVPAYDQKIKADLNSVKSSSLENKQKSFVEIMNKVKAASTNNKVDGAKEAIDAWISVGAKAAEALGKIIDQYKDKEGEGIEKSINDSIDSYFSGLEEASEDNQLKDDIKKNESLDFYHEDFLNESVFKGKKGMIEDVSKQITIVLAKLSSFEETEGMEDEVKTLRSEVNKIGAQMGNLLSKKNKDINKDEIKSASIRLSEIPTLLDKASEELLKQDNTNKEAASILVQALGLIKAAKEAEIKYFENKEKSDSESQSTAEVSFSSKSIGKVQPEVKEFQELVTDKFKNSKQISSLEFFKKMGTDGKYGPSTKAMVGIMKSGFGLKDTSENTITKELIDELKRQEALKEARIFRFNEYSGTINEAFDVDKALKRASSFKKTSSSSKDGSGKETKKTKAVVASEPRVAESRQAEVLDLANVILSGTTAEIASSVSKLKDIPEFKLVSEWIFYMAKAHSKGKKEEKLKVLEDGVRTGTMKKLKDGVIKNAFDKRQKMTSTGKVVQKTFTDLFNYRFGRMSRIPAKKVIEHLEKIGLKVSTGSGNKITSIKFPASQISRGMTDKDLFKKDIKFSY